MLYAHNMHSVHLGLVCLQTKHIACPAMTQATARLLTRCRPWLWLCCRSLQVRPRLAPGSSHAFRLRCCRSVDVSVLGSAALWSRQHRLPPVRSIAAALSASASTATEPQMRGLVAHCCQGAVVHGGFGTHDVSVFKPKEMQRGLTPHRVTQQTSLERGQWSGEQ